MHLVFVYGSLKSGFHNHDRWLRRATLVAKDAITERAAFTMRSLSYYPAVLEGGSQRVAGEVYSVCSGTLESLDMLEGEGVVYKRERVRIDGIDQPVWMYLYISDDRRFYLDTPNPEVKNGVATWLDPRMIPA